MIEGKRTFLRALERDDVERMQRWINDPEVKRHLVFTFPLSYDQELSWYKSKQLPSETEVVLGIVDRETNRHIGNFGFHGIDWVNSVVEVGIIIGEKDFWSKGLGTDAMRAALAYAFNTLNINRVFLKVYGFNKRAIRSYEKCGFNREALLREDVFKDGEYHDTIIMGLLRSEYNMKGAEE